MGWELVRFYRYRTVRYTTVIGDFVFRSMCHLAFNPYRTELAGYLTYAKFSKKKKKKFLKNNKIERRKGQNTKCI